MEFEISPANETNSPSMYATPSLAIVGVQGTGTGSAPSDSGSILTITVEGLNNTGRPLPPTIGGVANEGGDSALGEHVGEGASHGAIDVRVLLAGTWPSRAREGTR